MNVSGDMSSAAPGPKVLAEAERWYARLKTSNCSAGQRAAFDRWCADPEHAAAYTQTERLWEGIGGLAGNPELEALSVQALRATDPRRRQHRSGRSDERRVGKECGSTCRSRGQPYNKKKN